MTAAPLSPAVRQLEKIPPYVWLALVLGVGLATLVWHRYGQDPEDTDWLDPGQPPLSVDVDFTSTIAGATAAPGSPTGGCRRPKPYPWGSLLADPKCWVGDC